MELRPSRIIRSSRRTVALEIRGDATFVVRAPRWVSRSFIDEFIVEKSAWLELELSKAAEARERLRRCYRTGERFAFLGFEYPLRVVPRGRTLKLETEFLLPARLRPRGQECFERWYRREAKRYLTARVFELADRHGYRPTGVKVTGARTNWGSCGPTGGLNFSWRLIMAPRFVVDYVVMHELAHLSERNHSAAFWRRVQNMCPEWRTAKAWLVDEGRHLMF
jgi:hypothetical protein